MRKPLIIAVLVACHNRRDTTIRSLQTVINQQVAPPFAFEFYVVDDGSTDGTAESVRRLIPSVYLLIGDGSLYWNRAMRKAMKAAYRDGAHYFWLINDDVEFFPDALEQLLSTMARVTNGGDSPDWTNAAIVSGATRDPLSGHTSYGGARRKYRFIPSEFEKLEPTRSIQRCSVVNMNATLISRAVVDRVGYLSRQFRQGRGDFDYSLRAREAGIPVYLAPGWVGRCELNPIKQMQRRHGSTVWQRFRRLLSLKHKPLWERSVFLRRHGGVWWPLFWIAPYFLFFFREMRFGLQRLYRSASKRPNPSR